MMESRVPTGMLPAPIGTQSQGDFPSGHPACFLRLCIYKPHFAFDILSLENIKAPQLPSCMRMKVAAVFILHRQIVILYFQHSRHKVCSTSSIYSESTYPGAYCAPLRASGRSVSQKMGNFKRYTVLRPQSPKLHGFSSTTPKCQAMASAILPQAFPSPYGFTACAILA